jgi:hypothetical protein
MVSYRLQAKGAWGKLDARLVLDTPTKISAISAMRILCYMPDMKLVHPNAVPLIPHDAYFTDFLPLLIGVLVWLGLCTVVVSLWINRQRRPCD